MPSSLLIGWYSARTGNNIIGGSCHKYNFCRDKHKFYSRKKATANDIILRVSKKENCGFGKKDYHPDIFTKRAPRCLPQNIFNPVDTSLIPNPLACFTLEVRTLMELLVTKPVSLFYSRKCEHVWSSMFPNPLVCFTLEVWTRMELLVTKPVSLFYPRSVNTYGAPCYQTR